MDVTVPAHGVKRLAASIACLGKIGKDLYLSFDPLEGLTLSSLNEAKSAYGRFHFDSGFFERCSHPPPAARVGCASGGNARNGGHGGDESDDDSFDSRYVCRVPVRSVHSVLRPRKGVISLRIRSEGTDSDGNYFGLNKTRRRRRPRGRSREGEEERDDVGRGRGSFSARERSRSRMRRKRGRVRRTNDGDDDAEEDRIQSSMRSKSDRMMLSFEFYIERPASTDDPSADNPNAAAPHGGAYHVLHKVGVTDANGIALSANATQRRTRSEIISPPKLWMRLLDPLRRTAEVALTIDDVLRVVTATSFHPGESQRLGNGEQNAVLREAAARNAVLKTETSTGVDEFDEYDFRNNRGKKRRGRKSEDGSEGDDVISDDEDQPDGEAPPPDVNEKVILVFGIKEAKAMLQYGAQSSSFHDDGGVVFSFHWGGRPVVMEVEGEHTSAELVLATLHHGMITSNISGDARRSSSGGERK